MLKIKKSISIILIVCIFSAITVSAKNTEINSSSISGTVLEILDTDALKVSLDGSGEIAYVKLKGIDGKAYNEGYEYLTNVAMGQKVTIIKDFQMLFDGKYNYANVYLNGINLNEDLVSKGYAIIDKSQPKGSEYNKLVQAQNIAYSYNLGIWESQSPNYSSVSGQNSPSHYIKDKININTASLSQLKTLLQNVPNQVCEQIIYYRERNPFTVIEEIKFVKGFTKDLYDKNKNIITVSTNINTANEYELATLGLSNQEIEKLIETRNKNKIKNINEINYSIISSTLYSKIKYFISTEDLTEINYIISSSIANINGSDKSYLQKIGLSSQEADEIINNRKNGYTYKTLEELLTFKDSYISLEDINKYEDNLKISTNLNTSNEEELIYLFGNTDGKKIYKETFKNVEQLKKYVSNSTYEKYKQTVYVDKFEPNYININTASKQQLLNIGLTEADANKIISKRPILNSKDLPFDIKNINEKVSIYTNINKATRDELLSLGLDNVMINLIISYRSNQPFASKDEIKTLFEQNNYKDIYFKIEKYLVLR